MSSHPPLGRWLWFAGEEPDVSPDGIGQYDLAECDTYGQALQQAREQRPTGVIHLIQARCYQHREDWEAEDDPIRFAITRGHERILA